MVVEEVRREEAERTAKASLVKQGQWMRWEGLEKRKLGWRDLWEMEAQLHKYWCSHQKTPPMV